MQRNSERRIDYEIALDRTITRRDSKAQICFKPVVFNAIVGRGLQHCMRRQIPLIFRKAEATKYPLIKNRAVSLGKIGLGYPYHRDGSGKICGNPAGIGRL